MRTRPHRIRAGIATLTLLGVVAAACGDSEDRGDDATPDSTGRSTGVTIAPEGEAQRGGTVRYAVEAETDGYNPTTNRWAIAGFITASAFYDPLVAIDAEGQYRPYLAESITPNDTYTEWTITLREGVTFHNGDTLEADHVTSLLQAHQASILTSAVFDPVAEDGIATTGPLETTVTMDEPWPTFPAALAAQPGFVPHPDVLTTEGGGLNPIGTGPFELAEYEKDRKLVVTRYDGYWQEGLPYLDEIEFNPIPEVQDRAQAFNAGDIQVFGTENREQIATFTDQCSDGSCQIAIDPGETDEIFVMLNLAAPPFDDPNARAALVAATNQQEVIDLIAPGAIEANGPWSPDSKWYDPDVADAYPGYDPAEAERLLDAYRESSGEDTLRFQLGSTQSPSVRELAQLLIGQWAEVGIEAELQAMEQASYIGGAVAGNYQANVWRQFAANDPDADSVWWRSKNAADVGTIGLNIARVVDEQLDEALVDGRNETDLEARKEAYSTVQLRLADVKPYVWLYHSSFSLIAGANVRGLTNGPLPDGTESLPFQSGYARVTYLWLEGT